MEIRTKNFLISKNEYTLHSPAGAWKVLRWKDG